MFVWHRALLFEACTIRFGLPLQCLQESNRKRLCRLMTMPWKNSWGYHDLQRVGDSGKKIDCELLVKSRT
jgi:hypothetical protein